MLKTVQLEVCYVTDISFAISLIASWILALDNPLIDARQEHHLSLTLIQLQASVSGRKCGIDSVESKDSSLRLVDIKY